LPKVLLLILGRNEAEFSANKLNDLGRVAVSGVSKKVSKDADPLHVRGAQEMT
jgi:hypothetical protein